MRENTDDSTANGKAYFPAHYQHNFDTLPAARRIPVHISRTDREMIPSYVPVSFFHRNGQSGSRKDNVVDWIQKIEKAQSNADVTKFFQFDWGEETLEGHWATVNFDNPFYCQQSEHVPKTIEFRQHAGILNFAEISG
jgi:hypothetical protein